MERRKLIKRYFFSLAVIFCIFCFMAGIITVSEKTRYNISGADYARVGICKNGEDVYLRIKSGDGVSTDLSIKGEAEKLLFALIGEVFNSVSELF